MIPIPELINGFFDLGGSFFTWVSVVRLWQDKEVKGTSWTAFFLYISWTFWEIFYVYPQLNMPYVVYIAGTRALGQIAWLGIAMYFKFFKNRLNEITTTYE